MKNKLLAGLTVGVMMLGMAGVASAIPITFSYEGVVIYIPTELSSAFNLGETLSIQYSFETSTPDMNANPNYGVYSLLGGVFGVNSYQGTATTGQISVYNGVYGYDEYIVTLNNESAPNVGDYTLVAAQIRFSVFDNPSYLSDDELLSMPPELQSNSVNGTYDLMLNFSSGDITVGIIAPVSSAVVLRAPPDPVPEPTSMLLFGTGLVGLSIYRRVRFKKC